LIYVNSYGKGMVWPFCTHSIPLLNPISTIKGPDSIFYCNFIWSINPETALELDLKTWPLDPSTPFTDNSSFLLLLSNMWLVYVIDWMGKLCNWHVIYKLQRQNKQILNNNTSSTATLWLLYAALSLQLRLIVNSHYG